MNLKKSLSLFAVTSVVLIAAGCGGGAKPAPAADGGGAKGDAAKGKEVFTNTCAACHGDGHGLPGVGKNLVDKDPWMQKQSDTQLAEFIKKGRPTSDPENTRGVDMPPKGGNPALTDEDLTNVVSYIREMQKSGKNIEAQK